MKNVLMMITVLLGTGLLLSAQEEEKGKQSDENKLRCKIRLKNRSYIQGHIQNLDTIRLKTRYGVLKVPVKDIRALRWGKVAKEELDTVVTPKETYRGWIQDFPPLQLDTGYGVLKIPPTAMESLRVQRTDGISESFETDDLSQWSVHGGNWQVTNGTLGVTSTGNYQTSILYQEELDENYTIHVEASGQSFGILWNAKNGTNANAFWLSGNQAYIYAGNPWYNFHLSNWAMPRSQTQTNKYRLEIQGKQISAYINEQFIGKFSVPNASGKVGLFAQSGTATFDNFEIVQ